MLVINDDYRLLNGGRVKEGGLARNEAILSWLKKNKHIEEIQLNRGRLHNAVITIETLLTVKNQTVYIFYPTVGVPVLKNGIIGSICSAIFFFAFIRVCKRNKVAVDICDLKYEQAIDLEIDKERLSAIERTERRLFNSNCDFVFASKSMMEYAIKKYAIESQRCHVLENGGDFNFSEIEIPQTSGKLKLVYAGTLNKGRCIEAMIESVRGNKNTILYLCGTGGEWIKSSDNIVNLGSLEESQAHYVVSECDLGLIPYDSSKMYYNIAYPTKLAFYFTAGIPFVSTNVREVKAINEKYQIGYISDIQMWSRLFETISIKDINEQKKTIKEIYQEFSWKYKCEKSYLMEIDEQ